MIQKMRHSACVAVYTCCLAVANPVAANDLPSQLSNLTVHATGIETTNETFLDPDGNSISLRDFAGKVVVLNFWATWCAPCREEMPSLAQLFAETQDHPIELVAVATGPNPPAAIEKFLQEIDTTELPIYSDPRQKFARSLGVLGLPATLIIAPDGQEVARLVGEADWAGDEIVEFLMSFAQ